MFCAVCWPRLRVLKIISDTLGPSEWPDEDLFRARGSPVSHTLAVDRHVSLKSSTVNGGEIGSCLFELKQPAGNVFELQSFQDCAKSLGDRGAGDLCLTAGGFGSWMFSRLFHGLLSVALFPSDTFRSSESDIRNGTDQGLASTRIVGHARVTAGGRELGSRDQHPVQSQGVPSSLTAVPRDALPRSRFIKSRTKVCKHQDGNACSSVIGHVRRSARIAS